jgi:hypothetical protein
MKISSIAINTLIINIFVVVFALLQQYFQWNIFPPTIEGFIKVSFYSFQVFTLMVFLAAMVDEIKGIAKSLTKISNKI